jgi:glycosyltransferase involved in cell wall biosynthesis
MPRHISIVIPVFNEAENLPELIERLSGTMEQWCAERTGSRYEILICDDHSTDASFALARTLTRDVPNLRALQNSKRSGQTGGFRTGFQEARGDTIVTMDGDLQVLPEDVPRLLSPLENDRLLLTNAVRAGRQHSVAIKAISSLGNSLLRLTVPCPVADAASNFTAFPAALARDLPLVENDHRYLIPILIRRGLPPQRIGDVEVRHEARKRGVSKYSATRKLLTGVPELLRFRQRWQSGYYDLVTSPSDAISSRAL